MSKELFPSQPLDFKETPPQWDPNYFGARFSEYMNDFSRVDRDNILPGIFSRIARQEKPVILDLLAPTATLHSIYTQLRKGIKGLAVGLKGEVPPDIRETDKKHGISYYEGDLADATTWEGIQDWIGNDKAHLVMERGYGGLHCVPNTPEFYGMVITNAWNLLDPDNGVLLLQTPPKTILKKRGVPIDTWVHKLQNQGIYHQFLEEYDSFDLGPTSNISADTLFAGRGIPYGMLMIVKNSFDQTLPTLTTA